MELEIGIACGSCDTYSPMGTERCPACGHDLALYRPSTSQAALPAQRAALKALEIAQAQAKEQAKEQAKQQPKPAAKPLPREEPPPEPPQKPARARTQARFEEPAPRVDPRAEPPSASVPRGDRITPASPSGRVVVPKRPTAPELQLSPIPGEAPPADARPQASGSSVEVPQQQKAQKRQPPSYAHLTQEELMDQARHYLCWQCFTPVPSSHKFCGRCGAEVPVEIQNAQTIFFSDMQNPAKARLVVIRGEGMDGVAYHLKMEQHLVGKTAQVQIPFPDDPFVSPKHANFFYRDGRLVVRDEGSLNGVYVRVRGSVDIAPGDMFLAGEQVFRLDQTPRASDGQDSDGTYFYSSPKYPSPFRITQILQGGAVGMTVCARGTSLQLGREGGDLNFPADIYMSSSHCRIEENNGKFTLTDLNSRNGTYVRVKAERDLGHGDYLFVGRKLMRVEMTA